MLSSSFKEDTLLLIKKFFFQLTCDTNVIHLNFIILNIFKRIVGKSSDLNIAFFKSEVKAWVIHRN